MEFTLHINIQRTSINLHMFFYEEDLFYLVYPEYFNTFQKCRFNIIESDFIYICVINVNILMDALLFFESEKENISACFCQMFRGEAIELLEISRLNG